MGPLSRASGRRRGRSRATPKRCTRRSSGWATSPRPRPAPGRPGSRTFRRPAARSARQLAGLEVPAAAWEREVLRRRVRGYRPEWLDEATLSGEVAWGRLWASGASAVRSTPVALFAREDMDLWLGLSAPPDLQ